MIVIDDTAGIRTVTLNRPDKANALTLQMIADLTAAVSTAAGAGLRAVVLTGAGRVFSAGMDLDAAGSGLATDPAWEQLSAAVDRCPCLTVAALNGTVAGGALGMVLACDLRLAVPGTKAFYPVMKLGFLPQPSDPARLVRLVGPARAKMILMGGAKVVADEALAWGLFDRIVASDALLAETRALCADVCAADPAHVAGIRALIGM